jgi:hypothetical protein
VPEGASPDRDARRIVPGNLASLVRAPWRGTGASRRIHDALVTSRGEERVTLLVHKEHGKVRAPYESWEYETVGECMPFEVAPELCAMVLPLR